MTKCAQSHRMLSLALALQRAALCAALQLTNSRNPKSTTDLLRCLRFGPLSRMHSERTSSKRATWPPHTCAARRCGRVIDSLVGCRPPCVSAHCCAQCKKALANTRRSIKRHRLVAATYRVNNSSSSLCHLQTRCRFHQWAPFKVNAHFVCSQFSTLHSLRKFPR